MLMNSRNRRRPFRPGLDRLEGRAAPVVLQPTVLEQVFLERINDFRSSLAGASARPFALISALNEFALKAATTRNVDAVKSAMTKARVPWDRRYSYTAGLFTDTFGQPFGSDPAQVTAAAEQLARDATEGPALGPWPLIGRPGNPLYRSHRVLGLRIETSGQTVTYHDITVSYASNRPLVTGVVYRDANANGKYDAGEGLAGVQLSAGSPGTTATWDTGGYTLPVNVRKAATLTVTASGGGLDTPMSQTVTVRPGGNSRLNFVAD